MSGDPQLELDFEALPAARESAPSRDEIPAAVMASTSVADPISGGEPLGIRMVNEFVYCPRLFYYEVVDGVFVHNADTLEGAEAHKRVDTDKPGSLEGGKKKRVAGKKRLGEGDGGVVESSEPVGGGDGGAGRARSSLTSLRRFMRGAWRCFRRPCG